MKIDEILVDVDSEDAGTWVEFPEVPGVWAKVRSGHNIEYQKALDSERVKLKKKYGDFDLAPFEVKQKIMARLMVNHLLVDLRGLEDESDQEIPYTKDFADKLINDRRYRRIRDFVTWAASVAGNAESEQLEDDAKNSETVSSGKQAGDDTKKR